MSRLPTPEVIKRLSELEAPWLVMLVGLPASGKSTFVLKLEDAGLQFDILSTDKLIEAEAVLTGKTYTEVYNSTSFKTWRNGMNLAAFGALRHRRCVVMDQTNMGTKSRRHKIERFVNEGYKCIAVTFDVPMKVLEDRLNKRAVETGKVIPMKVVKDMLDSYSTPIKAEGFERVWELVQ